MKKKSYIKCSHKGAFSEHPTQLSVRSNEQEQGVRSSVRTVIEQSVRKFTFTDRESTFATFLEHSDVEFSNGRAIGQRRKNTRLRV